MRAIARAHQERNLAEFEKVRRDYKDGVCNALSSCEYRRSCWLNRRAIVGSDNPVTSTALYNTLLEQNLLRIFEPYSVVEIDYVAEMVRQARQAVETK
jgi:26S proteasome regulatory subunit N6